MTMTAKRPIAPSTKAKIRRELGLTSEAAAMRAADQLGRLEDEGNAEVLSRLAQLYKTRHAESLAYADVLLAAERLRAVTKAYDQLALSSAADDQPAELIARGLVVLEPGTGASAAQLREMAGHYSWLARHARDAAQSVGK
jgi:hypothetical protein